MRTLHKDFARYSQEEDDLELESGMCVHIYALSFGGLYRLLLLLFLLVVLCLLLLFHIAYAFCICMHRCVCVFIVHTLFINSFIPCYHALFHLLIQLSADILFDCLIESQEDHGWKIIHSDVFRFPPYKSLFCSVVGNGVQVHCSCVLAIYIYMCVCVCVCVHVCVQVAWTALHRFLSHLLTFPCSFSLLPFDLRFSPQLCLPFCSHSPASSMSTATGR